MTKTFSSLLTELQACSDAKKWAGNMSATQVIKECHRGDWLLWLAKRLNMDDRKLTLAKAHCANTVRHLMKDQRSKDAVDAAIQYGLGNITLKQLWLAKADAAAAADADAAADAAAYAADAAAYAAADAAADAAAYAAAYAAADAAKAKNQKKTASICRKYIGKELLLLINQKLNA